MLFVSSYKLNYPKLKFLQEVMTQSNSPERDRWTTSTAK